MRLTYRLIALVIGASLISGMAYVSVRSQQPLGNEQEQVTGPLTWDRIDKISREITVLIEGAKSGSGAGVIIAKKRNFLLNTYYVLTAKTVVQGGNKFEIVTHEGKHYQLNSTPVKQLPGVDLAVLEFTSFQSYRVATLAKYDLSREKNPTGKRVTGGPVLDVGGRVIGMHGRSEAEVIVDDAGKRYQIQLGHSLGIPISTFLSRSSQVGMEAGLLQVKTSPSPYVDQEFPAMYKVIINSANKATENIEARSSHCLTYACEKKLAYQATANQKSTQQMSAVDWLNYGNQMSRISLPAFALEAYNQSIKLKPNFYPAWYARGLLMLRIKGDNQAAFEAFDKATKIEPTFYPAWRGRGSALNQLKRYKEAVESYDKAIQLNPKDLTLQQVRSAVLRELQ